MNGAGAVTAIVLLEATAGLTAGAAWTQSWTVVRRGHFRIVGWLAIVLGLFAVLAARDALEGETVAGALVIATSVSSALYLLAQYVRSEVPAVVVGATAGLFGVATLVCIGGLAEGWPAALAAAGLVTGMLLLGAVINGMLLGHWYLNQPGLKPWALARLTTFAVAAVVATVVLGLAGAGLLAGAQTPGATLGLSGPGESFGMAFFFVWLGLALLTGGVCLGARRCVAIRSIQSATGLLYVALLTAAVAEFLVRYLMLNATG